MYGCFGFSNISQRLHLFFLSYLLRDLKRKGGDVDPGDHSFKKKKFLNRTGLHLAPNCRVMATTHKRILSTLRRNGPARRNLFGPVDREQLQVEYQAALRKDLEEASTRWGFDFISDKPLNSSDFQWEVVPDTRVPLLYKSCNLGVGQAKGQRSTGRTASTKRGRVEPPESEKENIPRTPEKCALNLEETPEKEDKTGMKWKQTNITDFYQAKRRVVWLPRKSGE